MASRFRINVQRKAAVEPPAVAAPAPAPAVAPEAAAEDAAQDDGARARAVPRKRARTTFDGGGVSESKGGGDEDEHGPGGDDAAAAPVAEAAPVDVALAIVPFGVSLADQANAPYVNGAGLAPMARPVAETRHGMRQFVVSQHGVRMFIQ